MAFGIFAELSVCFSEKKTQKNINDRQTKNMRIAWQFQMKLSKLPPRR